MPFTYKEANELVDDIICLTLMEYNNLGNKIVEPETFNEADRKKKLELLYKYVEIERPMELLFLKLKKLLFKCPPEILEHDLRRILAQIELMIEENYRA